MLEATALERSIRRRRDLAEAVEVERRPVARTAPTVVHAIHALTMGGAQQLVVDLVSDTDSGLRHETIASKVPFPRAYAGLRARVLECPNVAEIRAVLRHCVGDVLHLAHYHHPTDDRVAAWYDATMRAARLEGLPILQSNLTPGDPWFEPSEIAVEGGARHELVCCSRWSLEACEVPGVPGRVVHPGTPMAWFAARADEARRRQSSRSKRRVGFAARLDGDKIDPSIVEVLLGVLRTCPNVSISIAGEGGLRGTIEQHLESAGRSDRLEMLGSIAFEDLPAFHASLDLALAPMFADTFGSGSVHAIASGTPVVGRAVSALPEILVHPAAMASPEDPDAFADRVATLLEDERLRAEVVDVQRRHAEANFDVGTMRRRYAERLHALAGRASRESEE